MREVGPADKSVNSRYTHALEQAHLDRKGFPHWSQCVGRVGLEPTTGRL
jgi:hypothetical protein